MARKTKSITISDPGRDFGKTFVLVEMSARQAEEWAERALLALGRSASESIAAIGQMDAEFLRAGMAGIAAVGIGLFGRLRWEDSKPLLDEMFQQVAFVYSEKTPMMVRGKGDFACSDGGPNYKSVGRLQDEDIEEIATRVLLRKELFDLHLGFSIGASISGWIAQVTMPKDSESTSTSPAPSGP